LLVHAYVDGELDAANALAIKQQIDNDEDLKSEFANISALRAVMRAQLPMEKVSPGLRSRILWATRDGRSWARPPWTAMAASILLAAALSSGSTWVALRADQTTLLVNEIVDGHTRALISQHPTDVASSERHTVKPWFNGRLPQSPQVVDLTKDGFPLIGARIDVVGSTPVPTLVYGRRLHVISLTAVPAITGSVASAMRRVVSGYNVVGWTIGPTTYWAASDLNAAELQAFAKLFQAAG
jgi:anti-sigma factor RsiW